MGSTFKWSSESEIELFLLLGGRRPIGLNKHFVLSQVFTELQKTAISEATTQDVWTHLNELYDLNKLDENLNEDVSQLLKTNNEFILPATDEIQSLMDQKKVLPKRKHGRPPGSHHRSNNKKSNKK